MGSGLPDNNYSNYFSNKRFRFDFYIEGRYDEARIIPDCLREEEYWGGSKVNLIDTLNYGNYLIKLFDAKTRELIFSKGYCDLFVEWQTVEGAKDTTARYHECILFPAPKKKAILEIYKRDTLLLFNKLYSRQISPKSKEIKREKPVETKSRKILESGNSSTCIDIIFLSEGYQAGEEEKFYSDAARFRDFLFSWQPYKRYKNKFNLTAVFAPSLDSGVDIPGQGIFLNTIADAHFYTFGIERYLTLPDLCKVYNYLSAYPVDQVCVLANSSKYGGGGIYNYYNIFTTDNERAELLFLHEFGHGFASLGDEYFSSEVAYAELGSRTIEPYEPNITNLADFTKKWKNIISDTVPIPTPDLPQYDSVVGVFEGANYTSRGFYRPQRTCAMRSSGVKQFCKVCELSIERMIHLQLK
jgi:hypothetical protein